jgi:hypothetical protein
MTPTRLGKKMNRDNGGSRDPLDLARGRRRYIKPTLKR